MAHTYNTQDYPIKLSFYYIVNFGNFEKIKVYPVYFVNKKVAQRTLVSNVPKLKDRKLYYSVLKGSKLKKLHLNYIWSKRFYTNKYYYPKNLDSVQKRKSYRTLMRRRLRRMGLLSNIKPKVRVDRKSQYVKHIPNKQKVANSPNSIARVFQLERKPKTQYFYLLKRKATKIKGLLFKIKCLKIDLKKGLITKGVINIHRTDIILPLLITELEEKIKYHGIINPKHLLKNIKSLKRKKGKVNGISGLVQSSQ